MTFVTTLLMVLLLLTATFLIVLVLIQRGKGGGLAGALGGMGGQSAFGTKAGDLFTRITIGVATVWIILCMITVRVLGVPSRQIDVGDPAGTSVPASTEGSSEGPGQPEGTSAPAESPEAPGK